MSQPEVSSPAGDVAELPQIPSTHAPVQGQDWWRTELGARWPISVGIGLILLFAFGVAAPLADPDLPMHLAMGAWILRHRAVPWVEPFAWTRSGAPYFAYSWLPEVVYQLLYSYAGPVTLRVLHGLTQVATGAAVVWLAYINRWKSWTALILIFLTVLVCAIITRFLRPQGALMPLVLLCWALGLRVLDSSQPVRWAIALALAACTAANTHLLFPLTGLPLAVAITRTPVDKRRTLLIGAALVAGWLTTPYGFVWPKVFVLNFGHNPLFDYPTPIVEFTPGFRFAIPDPVLLSLVVFLALIPWALKRSDLTPRERSVYGAMWVVGLVGFGLAVRAIVVWWLATLPVIAVLLEKLPRPRTRAHERVLIATMAALPVVLAIKFARLDALLGGDITPPARASVEPLAIWLDSHAKPRTGARPRLLTDFGYGSYLTWRLPAYSMSSDGRTIFPDSVALSDAYRFSDEGPIPLGPWRSADLAIEPLSVPIAAVLDTARGWVRLGTVPVRRGVPLGAGLWAREAWLRTVALSHPR